MAKTLLEQLRTQQSLSKAELGRRSAVAAVYISWAEQAPPRFIPFPPMLDRLARALGYRGDPAHLLEEIGHE